MRKTIRNMYLIYRVGVRQKSIIWVYVAQQWHNAHLLPRTKIRTRTHIIICIWTWETKVILATLGWLCSFHLALSEIQNCAIHKCSLGQLSPHWIYVPPTSLSPVINSITSRVTVLTKKKFIIFTVSLLVQCLFVNFFLIFFFLFFNKSKMNISSMM